MAEPALAVEERGLLLGDDAQTSSSAAPRRRRRHLALAGLVVACVSAVAYIRVAGAREEGPAASLGATRVGRGSDTDDAFSSAHEAPAAGRRSGPKDAADDGDDAPAAAADDGDDAPSIDGTTGGDRAPPGNASSKTSSAGDDDGARASAESRHHKVKDDDGFFGRNTDDGDDGVDATADDNGDVDATADGDDDAAPHYCDGDDDYLINAPVDCIPRKTLGACEWCAINCVDDDDEDSLKQSTCKYCKKHCYTPTESTYGPSSVPTDTATNAPSAWFTRTPTDTATNAPSIDVATNAPSVHPTPWFTTAPTDEATEAPSFAPRVPT